MNTSTNSTTTSHTTSTGGGVGSKIKGAVQAVHGAGERLRGNVLDAADAAAGDAPAGTVDAGGRAEQAEGEARLHGGATTTQHTTTTTTTL